MSPGRVTPPSGRDARGGGDPRRGERGSALVITILVSVILALLGISFLLMGETENRIAQNEKRSAQAIYLAEAGARAVKRWFDHPDIALRVPSSSVVDRTRRKIVDETDPLDPAKALAADGVVGSRPYYKQGVDLDGDSADDLFDRPYRTGPLHALMGTPDGPDLVIDESDASAKAFLDLLTADLVADFPGEAGNVFSRIGRIEVFAPPYIPLGSGWTRYGLATVRVIARIYRTEPSGDRVLAEREAEAVLGEIPYAGPLGPLHSGAGMTFRNNGGWTAHWGPVTVLEDSRITLGPAPSYEPTAGQIEESLPREDPAAPGVDPLWNGVDVTAFDAFKAAIDTQVIDDPWLRLVCGGRIVGAPVGTRPWPPVPAPVPGAAPAHCCDHSGLAQTVPLAGFPLFDYEVWKLIASSGESDVRYFIWAGGDTFRENGTGAAASVEALTHNQEGVFFFETRDRRPPADDDGDGDLDNLTPAVTVDLAGWHFRGVIVIHAESFRLDSVPAVNATLRAPGEPFQDADQNGRHDPGERWVNLSYPGTVGGSFTVSAANTYGGGVVRNAAGPALTAPVSLDGVLYTSGRFDVTGQGTVYGTVIARGGVFQTIDDGSQPTPGLYWNEALRTGFPPPGWDLPRTAITAWTTRRE